MAKRNVTLSVEEEWIRQGRSRAQAEGRSLNDAFREWLQRYATQGRGAEGYEQILEDLSYARAGRKFDRDEANER